MVSSILLVLPIPFCNRDGRLGFDLQTCRHIACWAQYFDRVILACPTVQAGTTIDNASVDSWHDLGELDCRDRLELIPLPYAYRISEFTWHFRSTRKRLQRAIAQANYLCFAIGSLIGDWAALAALEAQRQQRDYAIWIDRVEYEITWYALPTMPLPRRIKYGLLTPLTRWYHHFIMGRASLGLLQGQDCYDAFAPSCPEPHLIHFVHIQARDRISASQLQSKVSALRSGAPLRLAYSGRAAEMKGPLDWLRTVHCLVQAGVSLEATWFGDGPLFPQMQALVTELGLTEVVTLTGFVGDREYLFSQLKQQHLFLFCHQTPESARCLIEALMCGCALVGYGSAYPLELVSQFGGGLFSARGRWAQLAEQLIALSRQPDQLAALITSAARSGERFSEESVFQRRYELMHRYIRPLATFSSGPDLLPIPHLADALPRH